MTKLIAYSLIIYGAIALLAVLLYIPKLVQFGHCFDKPDHLIAKAKRKIGIVVPARNESKAIGDLLASIASQTYDNACFDVNIIVKDEDDPTVEIAKAAGANVFVVPDQNCKGAALDGYFHSLTPEQLSSYDAFVIVDADAVIKENYVEELNNALEHNFDIYMTNKHLKNFFGDKKARSLVCNCTGLIYPILDEMGNFYRQKKNVPACMCGQGMMVRSKVIQTLGGWPYRTLTEDNELRLDSFLKGFSSMYYPYAVIYTEEVVRHKDAWARRLRWVVGFSQCDRIYKKQIRKNFKKEGAGFYKRYDCFFSLVPLIIFIAATIVVALWGAGVTIYYAAVGSSSWLWALLLLTAAPLALMYLLDLSHCLLTMIAYRDALKPLPFHERAITLFVAPLFLCEYFPIFIHGQICILTKKHLGWAQVKRVDYHKEK